MVDPKDIRLPSALDPTANIANRPDPHHKSYNEPGNLSDCIYKDPSAITGHKDQFKVPEQPPRDRS